MKKYCILFSVIISMILFNYCEKASNNPTEPANQPPKITSLVATPDSLNPNELSTIVCLTHDPEGDSLTFTWSTSDGNINGAGAIIEWIAPGYISNQTVTCIINDNNGGIDSSTITINVFNSQPVISILQSSIDTVKIGNTVQINCIASDPDGDNLTYIWHSNDGTITGSGQSIDWIAPLSIGSYSISCKVDDGNGGTDSKEISIEVVLLPISTQGLVGYWPIIGNANDMSGYSNDGIVMGAQLTDDRNGNPNSAYDFDGVDNFIEIGDPTILQIQGELTLSAWVDYRAIDSFSGIIAKGIMFNGSAAQGAYGIGVDKNTSKVCFEIKTELSDRRVCKSSLAISINTWYHIVATFTPGVGMKVYINGQIDGEEALNDTQINHYTTWSNNDIRFGDNQRSQINPSNPGELNGYIDEIIIFNRALSVQEIQILYQSNW